MKIVINKIDELEYRPAHGGPMEIYNIVVNSGRGQGHGTTMINMLTEIAQKKGFKRLYAFTRAENVWAHKFYEKNGFVGTDIKNFLPDGDVKIYVKEI